MPEQEKFILYEAASRAGKTTQLNITEKYLNSREIKVLTTRQPGGAGYGEIARESYFEIRSFMTPDQQIGALALMSDVWMKDLVIPATTKGYTVISDRGTPSMMAYQGYAGGANLIDIEKISKKIMGQCKPDAIVFFDISLDALIERHRKNNESLSNSKIEYYKKVIDGYREMLQNNWAEIPWYRVNGEQSVEDVTVELLPIINGILEIDNKAT